MQNPGRDLDEEIAERVLGWQRPTREFQPWDMMPKEHPGCCLCTPFEVPHFSTEMAAAWRVVDAFASKGWYVEVQHVDTHRDKWRAHFGAWSVATDTAPLAICRAALAAVEGSDA